MKMRSAGCARFIVFFMFLGLLAACDQMEKVASGVGGDSSDDSGPTSLAAESSTVEPEPAAPPEKVRLDAFRDFNCTGNWTNRDGGLGLKAGSGSGTCTVAFPGQPGRYRVTLMAQLEFDGGPRYKINLDGATIASGEYPLSKGTLICDCPNWRVNCPDRIVPLDAGVHNLSKGALLEFTGTEVYPCGRHGAYAKWRELVFTPAP